MNGNNQRLAAAIVIVIVLGIVSWYLFGVSNGSREVETLSAEEEKRVIEDLTATDAGPSPEPVDQAEILENLSAPKRESSLPKKEEQDILKSLSN